MASTGEQDALCTPITAANYPTVTQRDRRKRKRKLCGEIEDDDQQVLSHAWNHFVTIGPNRKGRPRAQGWGWSWMDGWGSLSTRIHGEPVRDWIFSHSSMFFSYSTPKEDAERHHKTLSYCGVVVDQSTALNRHIILRFCSKHVVNSLFSSSVN